MPNREQLIGENMQRLRSALSMSQADLASRMKDAGFKWSQATVWSVEKGERPLRLSEAEELSALLRVRGLDEFLSEPELILFQTDIKFAERSYEEFIDHARALRGQQLRMRTTADKLADRVRAAPTLDSGTRSLLYDLMGRARALAARNFLGDLAGAVFPDPFGLGEDAPNQEGDSGEQRTEAS